MGRSFLLSYFFPFPSSSFYSPFPYHSKKCHILFLDQREVSHVFYCPSISPSTLHASLFFPIQRSITCIQGASCYTLLHHHLSLLHPPLYIIPYSSFFFDQREKCHIPCVQGRIFNTQSCARGSTHHALPPLLCVVYCLPCNILFLLFSLPLFSLFSFEYPLFLPFGDKKHHDSVLFFCYHPCNISIFLFNFCVSQRLSLLIAV